MHGGKELVREEQENMENERLKEANREDAGCANSRGHRARIVEIDDWKEQGTSRLVNNAERNETHESHVDHGRNEK
jgi:hypothetical protein